MKILKDSYNNQEIKGSVDRAAEQKQDERNHIGGHFHFHHHHVHCSLSLSQPLLTFTTYTVYIIFLSSIIITLTVSTTIIVDFHSYL